MLLSPKYDKLKSMSVLQTRLKNVQPYASPRKLSAKHAVVHT